MTAFDKIFSDCAKQVGLAWFIVENNPDRNIKAATQYQFPCIWRNFNEPTQPLFDNHQRFEKEMSLYFVHVGFDKLTKEKINENLHDFLLKFVSFKDLMYRKGIELSFTSKPFPNWKVTNYDEYGIVFNVTAKYSSVCLTA